ncbi:MAG: M42 family peptidase [Oscillospiraceae bacterium]|nr:M42 family peptidase [Oscillospiraceae bacterium]
MDITKFKELTARLADAKGVSGSEDGIAHMCAELMSRYTDRVEIVNGNVYAHFGERRDKPHVLLDAHLDKVGLICTDVRDDGFISADMVGGIDLRSMPAQPVIIHGREDICGVICTLPPHLKTSDEVMTKDQLYIDTGLSPESAKALISRGDPISYEAECRELIGDRLCGAALDDRCGISTVIQAIDELHYTDDMPYTLTVMFSTQEEIGERGACIGAFTVDPDICIEVDVSFALAQGEDRKKCGTLGGGCMIGVSPTLDKALSDGFIAFAKENDIPFDIEVMSGTTGTNADRFTVSRGGARAVTLSVPLRNMHLPCEVIDANDCMTTAKLITAFLRGDVKC